VLPRRRAHRGHHVPAGPGAPGRSGLATASIASVAIAIGSACAAAPRPPPAPPGRTSLGLAISHTTLANGLRVIVVKDPGATGVQVTAHYQVGAVDDHAASAPGMAHLVEHLMFQQLLDGQPLFAHLEDAATSFNATTSFDATTFVARAPASALDRLLAIEVARLELRCQTLGEAAFAHEREVVINEIKQRDQATEVFAAIHGALYPTGHPYQHSIGGTVKTVSAITRGEACRFADAHYAPDNAVLVVSGNLGDGQIAASLGQLRTRIARRPGATQVPVPPAPRRARHFEVPAPIDDDMLVVAWPLPLEPELQARVRAIGGALPNLVDAEIKGQVMAVEFGDRRAPMLGLAVLPGDDETFEQAVEGTRRGIRKLPAVFRDSGPQRIDDVIFDRVQQSAIYQVYASLEDGGERDVRLAGYLLAGRDPGPALAAELRTIREMSRDEGSGLASRYLAAGAPMLVTLKASPGKKRGDRIRLRAPVHDLGPRRTPPDPARARRPADGTAPHELAVKTRVLRNGLQVVLLPLPTVPTLDARLVFRTGTADEPTAQRGVALLAAHTLTWDLHHIRDLFPFARAGGMRDTDVSTDRTSFSVQGLDVHLDVVLAGLRRWVWEGTYDDSAAGFVDALRRAAKRDQDQGPLTEAWRAALFGRSHPYVHAGIVRHANNALTLADAVRFREAHYTPDNATLVIAGRFDVALADRWIDYLFADWRGRAEATEPVPAALQPASIASVDDLAMAQLRIALPASAAGRAQQLIAVAMLNQIAHDVRHRLGASYAFDAQLGETRLATFYVMGGWIDAARAAAVTRLVRDRITELRGDTLAAARAFVTARAHVLAQLRSQVGSASSLADRVERDVEMAREPMSDLQTANVVQALTLDDMTDTIAALELSRAVVLMHGPAAEVKAAFDVLGRRPVYPASVAASPERAERAAPAATPAAFASAEQRVRLSDLRASLTEQPPYPTRLVMVAPGVSLLSTFVESRRIELTGYTLGAGVGYRRGWFNALGGHISVGMVNANDADVPQPVRLVPIDVVGFAHLDGRGRLWGDLLLGLHLDVVSATTTQLRAGILYGVQAGIDVARLGTHRIGIGVRWATTTRSSTDYSSLSLGLVYRQ
jgi:zinc protease